MKCRGQQATQEERGMKGQSLIARLYTASLRVKMIVVIGCYTNTELLALCIPLQINTVHYTAHWT